MKLVIDPLRCSGHGRCYSLAADLFADDDGRGTVIATEIGDDQLASARTAIANCPERAIALVD